MEPISNIAGKNSLSLLEEIFAHSDEGIVISDPQNIIVSANPAFSSIMGYQPEEVIGKSGSFFRSGRHDDQFYKNLWKTVEETGHWEGEIWVRRKSGETFPEWLVFKAVRNSSEKTIFYLTIFSDIT